MPQNPNPSLLDPGQIIKRVFDSDEDRIRVDIESTVVAGQQEVLISQSDDSIQVYGNDGTTNRPIKTDAAGELQVDVLSSALPSGAATAANQSTTNSTLNTILSNIQNPPNIVSTLNAYHSALNANASYMGSWEDVSNFSSIGINTTCQNPFTLRIHFSDDQGVTNDIVFPISVTGTSFDFNTPSRKRYMKFEIVNGNQAQTAIHLTIVYFTKPQTPFAAPFNFPTFDQSTAVTVRAGVMARDQSGIYHNLTVGSQMAATSLPVTMAIDQTSIPVNQSTVIPTISLNFTTYTPLGANVTFTGNGEDIDNYVNADISVFTDQNSAPNGLVFSWSLDGVNYHWSESFTVVANIAQNFSLAGRARYFKLSYTNGSIPQGIFQLRTAYYPVPHSVYIKNADDPIPAGRAVDVVQSVLSAEKENPTDSERYTNLKSTDDGILKIGEYLRPSQFTGRTYKTGMLSQELLSASNTLVYTVTPGKTLWVTSLTISGVNSSTSNNGVILVKDGNTPLFPLILGAQSTIIGSNPESIYIHCPFPQPLAFTSAMNVSDGSGGVTVSLSFLGYEETN